MTQVSLGKRISNLDNLNPNWDFAQDHGLASKPGLPKEKDDNVVGTYAICPCCLEHIDKFQISLWQNSKELGFLGFGFPLFYNLLKYCIILVITLIVTNSSVLIYQSTHLDCNTKVHPYVETHRMLANTTTTTKTNACISYFIFLSQSAHDLTWMDIIVRALSFCALLLFLIYIKDNQYKLGQYYNERTLQLTDYCVMITKLPKCSGIQQKIKDMFKKKFLKPYQIIDIILLPHIQLLLSLQKSKNTLIENKKKLINNYQLNKNVIRQIDREIEIQNKKMQEFCAEIQQAYNKDQLQTEKAIIIVNTEEEKSQIIDGFSQINKNDLNDLFENASEIKVQVAPEPGQILWGSINCPGRQRKIRIFIGWLMSILFLGVITVAFYFALYEKSLLFQHIQHGEAEQNSTEYQGAVALVIISLLLVQFFNKFVMKLFLHWASEFERHGTSSELQFSYALKYALGMFFTTAVMTLAVQAVRFDNYTGRYGVVEEETIIFLFNGFLVNLIWIIHPQHLIKKFTRWLKRGSNFLTQQEANTLMENVPYDMGKRYAEIIETMWFTFLYSSLIPIGPFITLIGLSIYYWVDKYNLLRRSKINKKIGTKLPNNAVILLSMILILKPLGELIFDWQLRKVVLPYTIVMICIGVAFNLLPWKYLLKLMVDEKFHQRKETYKETHHLFTETYRTVDPTLRHKPLEDFLRLKNGRENTLTFLKQYVLQTIENNQIYETVQQNSGLEDVSMIKQRQEKTSIKLLPPIIVRNHQQKSLNEVEDIKDIPI